MIVDNPVETHVIHPATGATTLNKTKLPTIEIKTFNGDFLQWRRFWEQFEITTHNDPDLSNINKFVYLQSLVEGKAAQAIDGLLQTRDNYDEAVQILTERFGTQQTLITAYMDEMVKIPKVTDMNDVTTLRTVYDKLDTNIRNLKDLSVETASYGSLLTSIIVERVPTELRLVFSRKFGNENWNLELMRIFSEELLARERCVPMETKNEFDENYIAHSLHLKSEMIEQTYNCVFCKGDHPPNKCFIVTNVIQRKDILRKERRCFVCFKSNHMAKDCLKKYACIKCNGRHHISVCTGDVYKSDTLPTNHTNLTNTKGGVSTILQSAV